MKLLFAIILSTGAVFPSLRQGPDSLAPFPKQYSAVQTTSGKAGNAYRLNINKINLPMNSEGVLAGVSVASPMGSGPGAYFANGIFLFSSGFFISGIKNGELFASGIATASGINHYQRGTITDGKADSRAQLYILRAQDAPFSSSWIEWKDAVALGASFYDGDGDNYYNPVDKNRNGKWDPNEDSPDLLGDEHVWCVYNDGLTGGAGRDSDPVGLEVRQSVFAYASEGPLGNILFVRYRIKYAGFGKPEDPAKLDSLYFGVWSDPDIGQAFDDYVGCDTLRNAGFIYNRSSDPGGYGSTPPCFLVDFFSGPAAYIKDLTYTDINGNGKFDPGTDLPRDTARSYMGKTLGVKKIPGAKNLGVSSFVNFMYSDPDYRDPSSKFDIRNAMLGRNKKGVYPNPCSFAYGSVSGGVNCSTVSKQYWFSGDPVRSRGWVNRFGSDHRMMLNTGPFEMALNEEKEIIVAYVVDQGSSPLNAVTKSKETDEVAQFIFDRNFAAPAPPPAPRSSDNSLETARGTNFIDLIWKTPEQVSYLDTSVAFHLRFQGYVVSAFASTNTADTVLGIKNRYEIARYDMKNFIGSVYKKNLKTGGMEILYPGVKAENRLDSALYADESRGKIRLRITKDPITGGELVKGKPYYFAVTTYTLNRNSLVYKDDAIKPVGTPGDYVVSPNTMVMYLENTPEISTVVAGEDIYTPPSDTVSLASGGGIVYDVTDRKALTGDSYSLTFFADSSAVPYRPYWRLENNTTKSVLRDSAKEYSYGSTAIAGMATDGFLLRIRDIVPECGALSIVNNSGSLKSGQAFYTYLGKDALGNTPLIPIGGTLHTLRSSFVKADRLRRAEIRFDETSNAYRYLNGFKGSSAFRKNSSFVFAEAIGPEDTAGVGALPISGWEQAKNRAKGICQVPFAVYVNDFVLKEKRRLAVGFIEKPYSLGGNPDGTWNPDSIATGGEYILIFDEDYDASCSRAILKGGEYLGGAGIPYADLRGGNDYNVSNQSTVSPRDKMIAGSPFLNALYAVALPKKGEALSEEDKAVINVAAYPLGPSTGLTFITRKEGLLTNEEMKSIFSKVNVVPNPLYGFNPYTTYSNTDPDKPFVTFTNLPSPVSVKIYTLSGNLIRELSDADKSSPSSPFLRWDLKNRDDLRAASGVYLAVVSSPQFGTKVLKFSIILPSLQLIK